MSAKWFTRFDDERTQYPAGTEVIPAKEYSMWITPDTTQVRLTDFQLIQIESGRVYWQDKTEDDETMYYSYSVVNLALKVSQGTSTYKKEDSDER